MEMRDEKREEENPQLILWRLKTMMNKFLLIDICYVTMEASSLRNKRRYDAN